MFIRFLLFLFISLSLEGGDLLSAVIQRERSDNPPVSAANPAKRIAAEKEEQGSERGFRRKEEAESSGLCDDTIPRMVRTGNDYRFPTSAVILALCAGIPPMVPPGNDDVLPCP